MLTVFQDFSSFRIPPVYLFSNPLMAELCLAILLFIALYEYNDVSIE